MPFWANVRRELPKLGRSSAGTSCLRGGKRARDSMGASSIVSHERVAMTVGITRLLRILAGVELRIRGEGNSPQNESTWGLRMVLMTNG